MKDFIAYLEANNIDKAAVKGGIAYDGISCCLRHGKFQTSEKEAMDTALELVKLTVDLPNFRAVNVRGIVMHNGGATIVSYYGSAPRPRGRGSR